MLYIDLIGFYMKNQKHLKITLTKTVKIYFSFNHKDALYIVGMV